MSRRSPQEIASPKNRPINENVVGSSTVVPLLCQVLQETLVVQQTLHALYAGLTSAEHSLGLRHEFPLPPGSLNSALHLDQQRLERIFEVASGTNFGAKGLALEAYYTSNPSSGWYCAHDCVVTVDNREANCTTAPGIGALMVW